MGDELEDLRKDLRKSLDDNAELQRAVKGLQADRELVTRKEWERRNDELVANLAANQAEMAELRDKLEQGHTTVFEPLDPDDDLTPGNGEGTEGEEAAGGDADPIPAADTIDADPVLDQFETRTRRGIQWEL